MDRISIELTFNGKTFHYDSGAKAYIFHAGIYNRVHKKYGYDGLCEFIELVDDCYLKDDNHTPLGDLADFVAAHFKKCKRLSRYKILELFYDQIR